MDSQLTPIRIIDSHTAGEPTRVVIAGGPDLGAGSLADRLTRFRDHHDHFRSAIVSEPRGSDCLVGALLLDPTDPTCTAAVIFFNNVGYLGMCGHGMIGVMATLSHLGRAAPGVHRIETPVGIVTATLHDPNSVSIRNVPSYLHAKNVSVDVESHGPITGDIAWGGNWFFLVHDHQQNLEPANIESLTAFCWKIRRALDRASITGADAKPIDHIELVAPSPTPGINARNFVLCPGGAYDRSPCGTGTSAKIACLVADQKLKPGQIWRQESIIGSVFEASAELHDGQIIPTIKGSAYITSEATLLINPADPFRWGISPSSR
ncbi:MAG TPA: 4-hydroxyproline epimerase [Tepidisphaeraceae bacterium]|jgi:4-hydroxyproline epimerase